MNPALRLRQRHQSTGGDIRLAGDEARPLRGEERHRVLSAGIVEAMQLRAGDQVYLSPLVHPSGAPIEGLEIGDEGTSLDMDEVSFIVNEYDNEAIEQAYLGLLNNPAGMDPKG